MRLRRILLTTTATMTIGVLGAGPALAHYCYRTGWNEAATSHSRSQAWMPIQDFAAMIEAEVPEFQDMCVEGMAIWDETITTLADQNTRVKGPGLLAGGTEGTGRTPQQFGYLMDTFGEMMEAGGPHVVGRAATVRHRSDVRGAAPPS